MDERAGWFAVLAKDEEPTVHKTYLIALLAAVGLANKVIAEDV